MTALLSGLRADRRLAALVAAGTAAVLIAAVLVVLRPWGEDAAGLGEGELATPRHRPDPVPAVPVALTGDCGVSTATIKALTPKARRSGKECRWVSTADGKRRLDVDLDAGRPESGTISSTSDHAFVTSGRPPRVFAGLGDGEAFARYHGSGDQGSAWVAFQVRGARVVVTHGGWRPSGGGSGMRAVPEREAMDGALRAAADVAAGLGVPARPVAPAAASRAGPPGIGQVPRPCDLVPAETLDKVVKGAPRARGGATLLDGVDGSASDSCAWHASRKDGNGSESRTLTVTVGIVHDRKPGTGAVAAARWFEGLHRLTRDGAAAGPGKAREFHALTGPGERAFSAFGGKGSERLGRVAFRERNVVVEVTYTGATQGNRELPADRTVRAAYTVALQTVKALRTAPKKKAAPPAAGDPVPARPLVTSFPASCGVSASTLDAVVPGAEVRERGERQKCEWASSGGPHRTLEVSLTLMLENPWPPAPAEPASALFHGEAGKGDGSIRPGRLLKPTPTSAAVRAMPTEDVNTRFRAVAGLGDDAIASYDPTTGATLHFRAGNVAGRVGLVSAGSRTSEKEALEDAARVAADVAGALGAPAASPKIAPPPDPEAAAAPTSLPGACTLLPDSAAARILGGQATAADATPKGCRWSSEGRALAVALRPYGGATAGTGARAAARAYLELHLDSRGEEPVSAGGEKYFRALSGLGEQAFGAYVQDGTPGRVVFRVRNVLVEVVFDQGEPMPGERRVAAAKEAAAEVVKGL